MPFSLGIVGLPNVGKSTLFTALTQRQVPVANYPFTTIDQNVGIVSVPDERLEALSAVSSSARIVPATVAFVDIAGLVAGAHRGEGLGNQFLAHIREVDAIVEVLRAFRDPQVVHVEGEPDPIRDEEILEAELLYKDLETLERYAEKAAKDFRSERGERSRRQEAITEMIAALQRGVALRSLIAGLGGDALAKEIQEESRKLSLLTAKPRIVILNGSPADIDSTLLGVFQQKGVRVLALDLRAEREAAGLDVAERRALGLSDGALDTLIRTSYELLGLLSFFTTGPKETRAWTIREGTRAPAAAGVIHSDFERKFIRADVVEWRIFVAAGGWASARAKGLVRSEGKEYIVRDGDVIEVKHA